MERSLTKTLPQVQDQRPSGLPPLPCRPGHRARTPPGPSGHGRPDGKPPLVAPWGGISLLGDLGACELCGSRKQVEVHHIRALKDLNHNGKGNRPEWARRKAARRRKPSSSAAHATRASTAEAPTATTMSTGEPRCSESEQVRFGGRPSEKGHFGTSLAAHPTASPVREETDGEGPGQGHLADGRLHLKGDGETGLFRRRAPDYQWIIRNRLRIPPQERPTPSSEPRVVGQDGRQRRGVARRAAW
jgi:hypothetical protein